MRTVPENAAGGFRFESGGSDCGEVESQTEMGKVPPISGFRPTLIKIAGWCWYLTALAPEMRSVPTESFLKTHP